MTERDIRRLGEGRWLVPLLALLREQDGARFAVTLGRLGIARDSLVRTLSLAIETGWVMRNPGYGHPLRPEYVLTVEGEAIGAHCMRIMAVRAGLELSPQDLPRWSLPIIWRLDEGRLRFSDLLASLAPVTPRALSLTLKPMIDARIINRKLEDGFPPASLYGLAPPGRALRHSLQQA